MSDLTEWFPARIKPVRNGIYETRIPGVPGDGFSYWTGMEWCNQADTPERAEAFARKVGARGADQKKPWRGIAKKP